MTHRDQLVLHALGLVLIGFLGYFKVLSGDLCAGLLIGIMIPSPREPLRAVLARRAKSDGRPA